MTANRSRHLIVMAALLAIAGSTGCTNLGLSSAGGIFGGNEKPAADPSSTYQIIFVPYEGKPEQVTRTLSGQMHIQEALDQVGAQKKYHRIQVELVRPLPTGGMHRIACEYDLGAKKVTPEFDYALLPGDRIVVKEDPSNMFDDMLSSALGPFGTKLAKKARGRDERDSHYQVMR